MLIRLKKKQTIIRHKNIKTVKYILPSKDVDIEKVLVSKKDFFLQKKIYEYFIGYLYDYHKFKPLQIKQAVGFKFINY